MSVPTREQSPTRYLLNLNQLSVGKLFLNDINIIDKQFILLGTSLFMECDLLINQMCLRTNVKV